MSKHTQVRASVRRRKVAHIAAISRRSTVNNCTIPKCVVELVKNEDNPNGFNPKINAITGNGPLIRVQLNGTIKCVKNARNI